jgi:hypothetical protein
MSHSVEVSINGDNFAFQHSEQTGRSIKERASIPLDHVLCLDAKHAHAEYRGVDELKVVDDCDTVTLEHGQKFLSHAADAHHGVTVTINKQPFEFRNGN